jgi:hemerythrin-like domain-containing protein
MPHLPDRYESISDLDEFHRYTGLLFNRHQIALMEDDPETALIMLKELEFLINGHIRDEEELLLPLYRKEIDPEPAGGSSEFYLREHEQIRGFLKRFIAHQPGKPDEISIVHYFDLCTMYKDLMDHHHSRERIFLYRLLDKKVAREEKKRILKIFISHQHYAG